MKMSMRAAWVWCLLAVLVMPVATYAQTQAAYSFNLPAQPLSDSLHELGSQTLTNIIFDPAVVADDSAPALKGHYDLKQALTKLLKGTNLKADFTSATTVVVKSIPNHSPSSSPQASKHQSETRKLSGVIVNGYAKALTATRSNTALKDIPQTITVISRRMLDQQNATDISSSLKYVPGIVLQKANAQQSVPYSRGFIVSSIHIDGGAPIHLVGNSINVMTRDLAEYGNITVLRGSDALFGGMGNPGATISLARKMPTSYFQAQFKVQAGSWDQYRAVGDVSGPLTSKLGGRLIVSDSRRHYFYHIPDDRSVPGRSGDMIYGIMQYKMTPRTHISLGGSYQKSHTHGIRSGWPRYDNGSDAHLPRSLALTVPWAVSDNSFTEAFVKAHHDFDSNWKMQANATYLKQNLSKALSALAIGPISSSDGHLPRGFQPNSSPSVNKQRMVNATLSGTFDWLGYKQHVMFGGDYEHNIYDNQNLSPIFYPQLFIPLDPSDFDPRQYPLPDFSQKDQFSNVIYRGTTEQWGLYAALRLQPIDHLSITAGGRLSTYRFNSSSRTLISGMLRFRHSDKYQDKNKFTPYFGVTYAFSRNYTAYMSFADIYHTNLGQLDKYHNQLPPANGNTLEVGLKGAWYGNSLNASLALFKVNQRGFAVPDPSVPQSASGNCCYEAGVRKSQGFETTVTGTISPNWTMTAGYTYNKRIRKAGSSSKFQLPKSLFKIWTSYLPSENINLSGGVQARSANRVWQCVQFSSAGCDKYIQFSQKFYAVLSLRGAYAFNRHWSIALNLNNLFNRKYYSTLLSTRFGNWYGPPANYMVTLSGKF